MSPILWMLLGAGAVWGSSLGLLGLVVLSSHLHARATTRRDPDGPVLR